MSKIKSFLSSILLMIGVLVGVALPTHFSVALDFGVSLANLGLPSFSFLMPNYSLSLYANTAPNRYTIHFNGNWNTTGSMADMNMLYDEMQSLPPNTFIKNWFAFIWWSTSAGWDVEYMDQTGVINLTTEDWWEVTLYAQWVDAVPYIIEYYQENIAWTWYDLVETGSTYGAPGTWIILTWNTYTWFTLRTWTEVNIVSGCVIPYYYIRNPHSIIIINGDDVYMMTWIKYWATIEIPAVPSRAWYEFVWWDPGVPTTMPDDDITITAIWKRISWWRSGWWWGGNRRPWTWEWEWESGEQHWTIDWEAPKAFGNLIKISDLEVFTAYVWAYRMWIISTKRDDSDPDGYVTRWDMAEMVVKFTENVLEKEIPPTPTRCRWWDLILEWKSPETIAYAEKACALWVMWIRMENFMPNKILDRAEFWTILSRLLWWAKYDVIDASITKPYYTRHLNALNEAWIMKQIENPEMRQELRKRAWLMMMRVKTK